MKVGVGVVYFAAAVPSLWLIERAGRRTLSLFQLSGCAVALAVLAILIAVEALWASYATIGRAPPSEREQWTGFGGCRRPGRLHVHLRAGEPGAVAHRCGALLPGVPEQGRLPRHRHLLRPRRPRLPRLPQPQGRAASSPCR